MPLYNSAKANLMNGSIDLDTDTIKVMLCTSSYTPNIDTHEDRADVTNEITGTGYTAGGETLANTSVSVDTTDDEGVFDADDVTWSTATITARYAVVYKSTGVSANDLLIAYIDFGSDQSSSASNFTLQWNAEGIVNIT